MIKDFFKCHLFGCSRAALDPHAGRVYFKRLVFKQVLTAFIYGQSVVKLSKNKVKRSLFLFKLIISVFVLILLKAITITLFF